MKSALSVEKKEIAASEGALEEAFCPDCGHPVTLRKRRLMTNRGYVYYWHHKSGGILTCRKRSRFRTR